MFQKYTQLRSWLRSIGVLKVVSWFLSLRANRLMNTYREEYEQTQPGTVEVGPKDNRVRFRVLDADHYVSLRVAREAKVVKCIVDRLRPGDIVWDIGANVGYYTMLCAKAIGSKGKVYAFEPHPAACAVLRENINLNGFDNVEILPLAMGRTKGTFRLQVVDKVASGVHRLVLDPTEPLLDCKTVPVEVISGDEWLDQQAVNIPQLIKLDVEGAEEDVLCGIRGTLTDPQCHTVIAEIHFGILDSQGHRDAPKRIFEFLQACGFDRLTWLDSSHLAAFRH